MFVVFCSLSGLDEGVGGLQSIHVNIMFSPGDHVDKPWDLPFDTEMELSGRKGH